MKIKFVPQNIEIEVIPGESVLRAATANNIEIKSLCKGVPSCAECRINLVSGENNVWPPSQAELSIIGTNHFIDGRRLACQVRCFGDITVDLKEQIERTETQTKKIRGFKTPKQMESRAILDTMILTDVPNDALNSSEPSAEAQNPAVLKQNNEKLNQSRNQSARKSNHGQANNQNNGYQGQNSSQGQNQRSNQNKNQNQDHRNNPNRKRR